MVLAWGCPVCWAEKRRSLANSNYSFCWGRARKFILERGVPICGDCLLSGEQARPPQTARLGSPFSLHPFAEEYASCPLLVLKGIYHNWTNVCIAGGLSKSKLCCSDVSKAQSRWTQPVWLCPEPRSKFPLWNFATGTRSAAGLRIRTAGPSTPQPPSPKTFQADARWELIPGCCLALDSARLPPFVFAMLLLLILGDSAFMALCTHLAHLAAMAGDGVGYSTFRNFGLLALGPSQHELC